MTQTQFSQKAIAELRRRRQIRDLEFSLFGLDRLKICLGEKKGRNYQPIKKEERQLRLAF